MKTLNLHALLTTERALDVEGTSYPMKAVTARVAMICAAASKAEGLDRVVLLIDAVCALVPTIPRALVEDMTVAQIGAVIAHASADVDAVEDAAGNAARPTLATSGLTAT